jgi:site-specific DNA recombinase
VKTAIYIRNSLDRDMTKVSCDYQRAGLLRLCNDRLDCPDPIEYLDRNVSATSGKRRPAYEALLDDIRGGIIGRVAVWDTWTGCTVCPPSPSVQGARVPML